MSPETPVFIGIDVGTTNVKASIADIGGAVLASATAPYPTAFVRPSWVEQDAEDWWRATVSVLQQMAQAGHGALLSTAAGISVSAQAPTLLPLDASGAPLRPALIWMDRRAEAESRSLAEATGREDHLRRSGNRSDPFFVAPKILWMRNHEPAVLARTATFVQVNGYVAYRLTGVLSMDQQHASLLDLQDVRTGEWLPDLLDMVGADPRQFPSASPATAVIGHVTSAAADATGLAPGIPVVAGTVDSAAAALEAGVVNPGQAAEMTGTSTVAVLPGSAPLGAPEFITMRSVLDEQWLALAAMVSTGASLSWLRDLVAPGTPFAQLTREAERVAAGSGGMIFLPYMMGERSPLWDSAARGMFLGLTLGTGVSELVRVVLEGTAFALRHNLEVAARQGIRPVELRSIGGPAASDTWCQIKADVCGVPVSRMRAPTGATFGDAMIAAAGTGHVSNLAAAVSDAASVEREFQPDPALREQYDDLFRIYLASYEHVKQDLGELARLPAMEP